MKHSKVLEMLLVTCTGPLQRRRIRLSNPTVPVLSSELMSKMVHSSWCVEFARQVCR